MKARVGPRAALASSASLSSLLWSDSRHSRRNGWRADDQGSRPLASASCSARPSRPREATLLATSVGSRLPGRPDRIIWASVMARSLSPSASVKVRRSARLSAWANHSLKLCSSAGARSSPAATPVTPSPAAAAAPKATPASGPGRSMSRSGVRESAVTSMSSALRRCSSTGQASSAPSAAPASGSRSMGARCPEATAWGWEGTSSGLEMQSPASTSSGAALPAVSPPLSPVAGSAGLSAAYMAWATNDAFRYSSLEKCKA
mmetsp:Transcript_51243/g.148792  ORF Transcript_51243/g.148792 Transcript_51243/m.148792 type:complete len:261 (-) Transcript_51243:1756-2538(-)